MQDHLLDRHFEFLRPAGEQAQWSKTHDYLIWTGARPADEPPYTIWELVPEGALRIPDTDTLFHIIPGGRPHHVEHLFGYWRVCDADIVAVRSVRDGVAHHALVLGGRPGAYARDALLWICPKCARELARREVETGPDGWERFWDAEAEIVAAFNDDVGLRTCRGCGFEHPLAYPFDPRGDSPAQAAARAAW